MGGSVCACLCVCVLYNTSIIQIVSNALDNNPL